MSQAYPQRYFLAYGNLTFCSTAKISTLAIKADELEITGNCFHCSAIASSGWQPFRKGILKALHSRNEKFGLRRDR
ncbi:hypothetical protein [Gloeocapsopsis dulcis]|uniref:hypothetical protein n=1 Tax=Gloeocapsopsis dulcis TaxID=2859516 RepID=UPI00101AE5CA|nr:hypothetical protein [Gloeocapsopsis dulcis]WNN88629.1 hypothetical protein P0S91_20475 [Gloeocapsopsis dulcis]